MKSGPNYRMSKSGKINLARTWKRNNRSVIRQAVIQGELHGAVVVRNKRDKEASIGS